MKLTKIAISLAAAGAMLTGYGLLSQAPSESARASQSSFSATSELTPIHGLASLSEVVKLFEQRSTDRPTDYLSRTQLGQALNAQAREAADLTGYERAESVLQEALEINPRWAPAQLALAGSLHSQHQFAEARDLAQVVRDNDSTSLGALALLGDASLELGDLSHASQMYEELADRERSAPVVSRLARLASLQGSQTLAIELALEAVELSDELALRPSAAAFYWFQAGHMYFEAGDTAQAIAGYERARSIDPGNPAATEALAFGKAAIGEHDAAIDLYNDLLARGPAPDLYSSLSQSLQALGRSVEAAEQMSLGMDLAQQTGDRFPAERRHLVDFYLTIDPARSVELARTDLLERQDWGAYDSLIWALYHAGRHQEAAAVIEQAPAEEPPYAAMMYHQAAVLAQSGEPERALALAVAAVELQPDFHPREAHDAQRLITELTS